MWFSKRGAFGKPRSSQRCQSSCLHFWSDELIGSEAIVVAMLRAGTLLGKFLFTIYLARVLTLSDFGLWTLMLAIVSYGIFFIGAETYNVVLRNYVRSSRMESIGGFSKQWYFFFFQYAILLVFGSLFRLLYGDESDLIIIICCILILEHATHEFHRLAIYTDEQIHANFILLIKSTGWMSIAGYCIHAEIIEVSLKAIASFWLLGAGLSLIYCVSMFSWLPKLIDRSFVLFPKSRLKSYIIQIAPFYLMSLAIQTPVFLSRYFFEISSTREALAVYGYYTSFGNGIEALFGAVVIAKLIPVLLGQDGDSTPVKSKIVDGVKKYLVISLVFWTASFIVLYLVLPYVNAFTQKEAMQEFLHVFPIIFAGQMFFSFGAVIQYGLYALNRDKELASLALQYLVLSVILLTVLIPQYGSFGAASAMCLASFFMFLGRVRQLFNNWVI